MSHILRSTVRRVGAFAMLVMVACSGDSGPGAPASLEVVAGAGQAADVGTLLPIAPSVRVRDAESRAVPGVTIRYSVVSGGGTITGDSARTDANGVAPLGSWRLGQAAGSQSLRAAATGTAVEVTITANAQAGPPAQLSAVSPQSFAALVADAVMPLPSVEVRDAFGNLLAGTVVTFTVTLGGGSATGTTVVSDAGGVATVGSWTLGQVAGLNRLTARAGTNASFIFEAQGLGAAPTQIAATSPTDQAGVFNFIVPKIPRVVLRDAFGNPSPGVPVTFTLLAGGDATLTGVQVTTGFDGVAAPGDWRMGFAAGSTVEASAPGFPQLPTITFRVTAVASPYLIDVRFVTPPTPDHRDAFATAGLRWMEIIRGDVPDVQVTQASSPCFLDTGPINELVDDVVIYALVTTIDGPGGILGRAGSCISRGSGGFSSVGAMEFDQADLVNLQLSNRLLPVILHEMGHVLGITKFTWQPNGLLTDAGTADPIFTGAAANAVWPTFALGYAGRPVPVHNADGAQSADSHWRESVLGDELMTPFVEPSGTFMPLSRLTIASLEDLGYVVDATKADAFASNIRAPSVLQGVHGEFLLNEVLVRPRLQVDRNGKITPIN